MWANHSRGEPVLDCVSDAKGPWHKDVVICWGPIWMLGYCVSLMGSHARPGDLTPLALLKWEMSSLWGRAVSEKSFSGWPEVVLRSLGACPIFFFLPICWLTFGSGPNFLSGVYWICLVFAYHIFLKANFFHSALFCECVCILLYHFHICISLGHIIL